MTDTPDTGIPKNDNATAGAPDAADGSENESMAQKSRPSSATIFTIATTIILTFIVLGFIGSLAQQPPVEPKKLEKKATDVEVMTVTTSEYVETVRLPSRIEADRVASVTPEIGGILKEWTVAEGAAVQAGDLVAVLDTELLESQMKGLAAQRRSVELSIQQAMTGKQLAEINAGIAKEQLASLQNDLSSAKSNYDLATKEYVRIKSLVDSESLNKSALDAIDNQKHQAKVGYDKVIDGIRISTDAVRAAELQVQQASDAILSAQAGIEQLDAGIESLSIQIRKSKVLAPIMAFWSRTRLKPANWRRRDLNSQKSTI
ncbi:MAG: biotin/lipoyl-binding protein [Planctomycetota bacterium]